MNETGQPGERQKRNRLVTIDDLAERVRALEEERSKLTITAAELRGALEELVEACEAGGTGRYMMALGVRHEVAQCEERQVSPRLVSDEPVPDSTRRCR